MTYENHSLRCWNCKFWWPLPDEKAVDRSRHHAQRGQCRRHAPPPMAADQAWAIVTRDEWCGEHVHVGS